MHQPFENLKGTTMTLIAPLTGTVALEAAFYTLPVTEMDIPEVPERKRQHRKRGDSEKRVDKGKIPSYSIPGCILSMRHEDETRGLLRSSKSSFKHSVTLDVSTSSKNVSVKLCSSTIHITGALSLECGREAVEFVLAHLHEAERQRQYALKHPEENVKAVRWVMEHFAGGAQPPEDLDLYLLNRYSRAVQGLTDPDKVRERLTWITERCPQIVTPGCEYVKISPAMVNYNFVLEMKIDPERLLDLEQGDFFVEYNNMYNTSIKFTLPIPERYIKEASYKKGKKPCHTSLVYHTGNVMHSAPCLEPMPEAYEKFYELMEQLRT